MAMKPSSKFERMNASQKKSPLGRVVKPSPPKGLPAKGEDRGGVAGFVRDVALAPAAIVASGIANRPKGMDKKAAARRNALKGMAGK